jgi:hypothetical protein
MKSIKSLTLTLGLAAASTLFLAGCGNSDQASHDHDGHDHSHGEEAHAAADAMTDAAGKMADAAATMAIVEKPTAEQLASAKAYPLDTCLVSGEKLGEMGEPVVLLVGNQQVKLCCDSCLPDVKKDTATLMTKLSK